MPSLSQLGSAITEADFQAEVITLADYFGWWVMHVPTSRRGQRHATFTNLVGWPDLVLWRDGGPVLYRELKTNTGRLSGAQQTLLASLETAGQDVAVWRPRDWDLIERTIRQPRNAS